MGPGVTRSLAKQRSLLMRFPLSRDTFPRVQLSTEDKHALCSLAQVVVDNALKQRHEFFGVQKGVVDKRQWKHVRQDDGIVVYKQRSGSVQASASAAVRSSSIPMLLTVGSTRGELDDVMYGTFNNSFESMRIKSAYIHNHLVDCVVLVNLIEPTAAEPLRSLQLKWTVKGAPALGRPFVRFRDTVYLEYTGFVTIATGERIGFQLHHSVQVAGVRDLGYLKIVRGQISLCCMYRQQDPGKVEVFATTFVDPMGKMSPSLAASAMAVSLTAVSRLVHCAAMKKLTWLLKTSTDVLPMCDDRSPTCIVCRKLTDRTLYSKKSCRACHRPVCPSCRTTKRLNLISDKTGDVVQHSVTFCNSCMARAASTSAMAIAEYENVHNELLFTDRGMRDHEATWSPTVSPLDDFSTTHQFLRLSTASSETFRIESETAIRHRMMDRRLYS